MSESQHPTRLTLPLQSLADCVSQAAETSGFWRALPMGGLLGVQKAAPTAYSHRNTLLFVAGPSSASALGKPDKGVTLCSALAPGPRSSACYGALPSSPG
jgi:hypothetical protein